MGNYLICLSTSTGGASIVSDIQNCTTGFEIAITYGVPQPPPGGPGGAMSFWPGALAGTSNFYDWLFQPLLTQGEFSASGWATAPAVWVQEPSGGTATQLGWDDSTARQGNLFVPRPGDHMKSYISYDKATGNWVQGMQDMTTRKFFACQFTAGQQYRGYACPDNTNFELIYFTIECAFDPTATNIWRGNIDAYATFTVDGQPHRQDFTDTNNWTAQVYPGVSGLGLEEPGLDRFKMVLPPVPAE